MPFGAAALLIGVLACATVTPEMKQVRVTNNPEVVRGCKFLGNTSPSTETQWQSGSPTNDSVFRQQVVKMGGNVGFITAAPLKPADGVGYYGEVYHCEEPGGRNRPRSRSPSNRVTTFRVRAYTGYNTGNGRRLLNGRVENAQVDLAGGLDGGGSVIGNGVGGESQLQSADLLRERHAGVLRSELLPEVRSSGRR